MQLIKELNMTSYFDIVPKELFIVIMEKMGMRIFDGIAVTYPRYYHIFSSKDFWSHLVFKNYPEIYEIAKTGSGNAYYWQQTYISLLGNSIIDSQLGRPLMNTPSPEDILYLHKMCHDYPRYYDIYKNINPYAVGINHIKDITWKRIYKLISSHGNLTYQQYSILKLIQWDDDDRTIPMVICNYTVMYAKKLIRGNYPGAVLHLLYLVSYNYSIYNDMMRVLNSSKRILIDTLKLIDGVLVSTYPIDIHLLSESKFVLKDDFKYRISLM